MEKKAAANSAAERYLAYAQKCNVPGAVSMLQKQLGAVKAASVEDPKTGNETKVASLEERLVDMVIEKYANEPKEKVIEMAKELGKILDENEITAEDLNEENLEVIKDAI
jgi:hypothetical protein